MLRLHGNTFNVKYTDRDICTSTAPSEVLVAFPLQQWLRERATILRYCLSCIIISFILILIPSIFLGLPRKVSSFQLLQNTRRDRQEKVGLERWQKIGIFISVSILMRVASKEQALLSDALQF
jgi:hypothetical protein